MALETVQPLQWRKFFDTLSMGLSIRKACEDSGISRATAYRYRNDPDFAWVKERWETALQEGAEYLEDTAHERAVDGVTSTYRQYSIKGDLISEQVTTKYSDRLLLAMLAARNPAYRNSASDQVQQLLIKELTRVLDLLQRKLPPDVYEVVIEILSTDDNATISATAAPQLASGESDTTGISR